MNTQPPPPPSLSGQACPPFFLSLTHNVGRISGGCQAIDRGNGNSNGKDVGGGREKKSCSTHVLCMCTGQGMFGVCECAARLPLSLSLCVCAKLSLCVSLSRNLSLPEDSDVCFPLTHSCLYSLHMHTYKGGSHTIVAACD